MNRRGFIGLLGLAPASAVGSAMPAPIIIAGADVGKELTWAIVTDARKEAEKARWRRVGILRPDGTFNPAAFAADARTRQLMRASESPPVSPDTSSGQPSGLPTLQLPQMIALTIPHEQPRGDP